MPSSELPAQASNPLPSQAPLQCTCFTTLELSSHAQRRCMVALGSTSPLSREGLGQASACMRFRGNLKFSRRMKKRGTMGVSACTNTWACQALVAQAAQHSFQQAGHRGADGVAAHGLHLLACTTHMHPSHACPAVSRTCTGHTCMHESTAHAACGSFCHGATSKAPILLLCLAVAAMQVWGCCSAGEVK
jgi:hypothetical protein